MAGVRRYQDLECWKLANELKCLVYDLIETSPARKDFGSLTETQNHLNDGTNRRHWTAEQVATLSILNDRAIGATVGWIRYLETTDAPPAHWEISRARPTRKRR
jgi:hypothetical protein